MNHIIIIITAILAALVTFYLSEHLKQGAVKASSLLSLLIALFFYFFPDSVNPYLSEQLPLVFIGASFIGMVSKQKLRHYTILISAGLLFGFIYINQSSFFGNYGGALGITSFIALISAMAVNELLYKKIKK